MSGFLASLGSQASDLLPSVSFGPSWQSLLRPASFRNVPFYVDEAGYRGGKRLDVKEFPYRDNAAVEDLGRAARRFTLRCYVIGDGYMAARDALEQAVEGYSTPALLVHPYRGNLMCRAGAISSRESRQEGGWATFDIEFVLDGQQQSPSALSSTSSGLLSGLASLLPVIAAGYGYISLVISNPGVLAGFATTLLGNAASSFLGLPAGTLAGLTGVLAAWTATPSDTATTASIVTGAFDAAADNVVAAAGTLPVSDPVDGTTAEPAPADFTGGLAALATYGDGVPPIAALSAYYGGPELSGGVPVMPAGVPIGYSGYTGPTAPSQAPVGVSMQSVQQAVSQQAIVDMIEGAALYAVITIASQTVFAIADDADAARTLILALLDRRIYAAAAAGDTDLYRAWSAIGALAIADLIARAQGLPSRTSYTFPASRPSVVLAQRLYADATRSDQLAALNNWPHPFFMPPSGVALTS